MPTYSYACTACDHRFDAQQSFADPTLSACPECSGRLRKLFGSVGVVFKGPGFYRTDARAGSTRPGGTRGRRDSGEAAAPAASGTGAGGSSGSTGSPGPAGPGTTAGSGTSAGSGRSPGSTASPAAASA